MNDLKNILVMVAATLISDGIKHLIKKKLQRKSTGKHMRRS